MISYINQRQKTNPRAKLTHRLVYLPLRLLLVLRHLWPLLLLPPLLRLDHYGSRRRTQTRLHLLYVSVVAGSQEMGCWEQRTREWVHEPRPVPLPVSTQDRDRFGVLFLWHVSTSRPDPDRAPTGSTHDPPHLNSPDTSKSLPLPHHPRPSFLWTNPKAT